MGFRFRRSVKIAPGVRLNFSKKSTSVSFGGKGARYTVSSTGRQTASVGIPGTGLSYVETVGGKKKRKDKINMSAMKTEKATTQKQGKPKKPITKKWWFWTILVGIVFSIATGGGVDTHEEETPQPVQEESVDPKEEQQKQVESVVTEEPESAPTVEPEEADPVPEPEVTAPDSEPPVEEPKVESRVVVTPVPEEPVVETPPVVQPEPVPDPEAAFREMLMQYNYVGSAESDKYHKPKCRWTKEINDQNLVHFDTEEEAAAANYKPCGTCKP